MERHLCPGTTSCAKAGPGSVLHAKGHLRVFLATRFRRLWSEISVGLEAFATLLLLCPGQFLDGLVLSSSFLGRACYSKSRASSSALMESHESLSTFLGEDFLKPSQYFYGIPQRRSFSGVLQPVHLLTPLSAYSSVDSAPLTLVFDLVQSLQ